MNKGKKNIILVAASAAAVIIVLLMVIVFTGREKQAEKTKIGLIMSGSAKESGWNGMHYDGVKAACEKYNAELLVKESVEEFSGKCGLAIEELVQEGVGMIILSSYNYSEEVKDLVKNYPETVFYVNSSEYHDRNMTSYFVRMYQARYMAGIVAGMKTESNTIGYVAAMANNEVNRGINAFTLGVQSVNPDAKVVVSWTGAWDDKDKEVKVANALIDEKKADVLAYHQNQSNVVDVAEKAGVYSIGYHEARQDCSSKYLTCVVCKWELVYRELLREYLVGKGNIKDNYWIGLEADAVGLSTYSEQISKEIEAKVDEAKKAIFSGKDVFSGVIYDTEGKMRCNEKETIIDEILLEQMDWYVKGVEFYEK